VHNTEQHPFQDVMAQRGTCSKGRAPHSMVNIGRAEGCATILYYYIIIYYFTDTHNVAKHSAQVHSAIATLSVTARQAMHGGN
jgi:hypothetical protein